uniref:Large polyvalent protein associated domain-containing protein n=1 Tax=viral metagenome TaxID=1070528 RepID=A0A6M3IV82_9ZZZZ
MPDLQYLIDQMDDRDLEYFKDQYRQKMPQLSLEQQQTVLSRIQGIPRLADLYSPKAEEKETDVWWTKPLEVLSWPSEKLQEHVVTPMMAPFTEPMRGIDVPWWGVPGTPLGIIRGLTQYQPGSSQRQAYEEWESPTWHTGINLPFNMGEWDISVKGAVEFAPWLAVPPVAKVATALRGFGTAGKIAAGALAPAVATEKALVYPLTKLTSIIKAAKRVRGAIAPIRAVEKGERFGLAEEAWRGGEGVAGFRAGLEKLKGEYTPPQFAADLEQLSSKDVDIIFNAIRDMEAGMGDKISLGKGIQKIFTQVVPQDHEIALIEKYLSPDLAKALVDVSKSGAKKAFEIGLDAANAPRAILASFDLSGLLRQGGILATRHPLDTAKSVAPMLRAFAGNKFAQQADDVMRQLPHFQLGERAGLYIAPTTEKVGAALATHEEMFMSRLVHRLPVIGTITKASERAYVTVLNQIRARVWETTVSMWERIGAEITDVDLEDLAKFINYATGRGNLGKLGTGNIGPLLNATFFAPRLILSRVQLPTLLFSRSPLVRKEAWQTLTTFLGTGTALLSLLELSGRATIELDPRSADAGKAKIGATRLDFWTGYLQYARFITQFITAQRKTQSGNISELNRLELVQRFAQSKFAPAVGLITDILSGESYMGESMELDTMDLGKQAWNRLVPLFVQDMADAINMDGLAGGFTAAPALFGVGVVTYTDDVKKIQAELAKPLGANWDDLDKETKLRLEHESPELKKALEERDVKTRGTTYSNYYANGQGIEKIYQQKALEHVAKFKLNGDGKELREAMSVLNNGKRLMYAQREGAEEFAEIAERNLKPLTDEDWAKMHPNDRAAKEYYDAIFADDLYDEFGDYNFEEAERRKAMFVQKNGQEALDYVERVAGLRWQDKPPELVELEQAKKALKPYWGIEDEVMSGYPAQYKEILDQIRMLENQEENPQSVLMAKRLQRMYPAVLRARDKIARMRKMMRIRDRKIDYYFRKYYL